MADGSKIEWLARPGTKPATWNPITGCTKISEGCRHCYAERMAKRLAGRFGYPEGDPFAVTPHFDKFDVPFKWSKPRTVFECSMGDLFHEDVGFNVHQTLWGVMERTPQHTYIILTKRPGNMLDTLEQLQVSHGILPNVWLGVTAENQRRADERIPLLLQTPAAVRFVSIEPMLGPVALDNLTCDGFHWDVLGRCQFRIQNPGSQRDWQMGTSGLDWVICGGETGPGACKMDPEWARSLELQCYREGVPYFFKQMSNKDPIPEDLMVREWPTDVR